MSFSIYETECYVRFQVRQLPVAVMNPWVVDRSVPNHGIQRWAKCATREEAQRQRDQANAILAELERWRAAR